MSPKRVPVLLALSVLLVLPLAGRAGEARLLRFPHLSAERVVFVYAGDLWTAPLRGGQASRLTAHPGEELFPRFSPDGKWIAFTGDYDGNREVYVMPATGGEPRRLTYSPDISPGIPDRFGPDNAVIGWSPDGRILYRSRRDQWNVFMGRIWAVSPQGGPPRPLPLPYSGFLSLAPDGRRAAYTPTFRAFRTWKRYRGGLAQDIYLYDFRTRSNRRLTSYAGVDDFPMWSGDKIYFVSERGGRANLWVYDLESKRERRLTSFSDYDVKFPALGPGAIVFELGGWLYRYDLKSERAEKIPVSVPSDRVLRRPHFIDASPWLSEFWLAPDARRLLIVARGELFSVPAQEGRTINLSNSSASRERSAQWSPDGKWIAYLSDASGEYEVYLRPADGSGPARRLTGNGGCMRFQLQWSPDSKKLAFADKNLKLWWLDIDSKKLTLVDRARYWEIRQYSWSPDSRWLAYARPGENLFYSIFLFDSSSGKRSRLTGPDTDDRDPVFDPAGKYLYFVSCRDLDPLMPRFESNYAYVRCQRPYALSLAADTPSPFAPRDDRVGEKESEREQEKKKSAEKKKPVVVKVDLAGIVDRAVAFPVPPGNYSDLRALENKLLWLESPDPALRDKPATKGALKLYDLKERKLQQVHAPVQSYETCADGSKLVYRSEGKFYLVEPKPDQKPGPDIKPVKLDDLRLLLDPAAEWRQIFAEAWRLERDYYYAANMHGVDWVALRRRYAALLPHVAHRSDLVYLIGEMIGELGSGHSYVGGGERPRPPSVSVGLLGAELEADAASGRWRIRHIFAGLPGWKKYRSPLRQPGLNVKAGDYLLAIDGHELRLPQQPGQLLLDRAGKQVRLRINRIPSASGSREITVVPVAHDSKLRYLDWVERNRRYVEKKTGGRVGYIHLPDMSGWGVREFARTFYPQVRKQGLIIDVRWNGGGFVSEMLLERLRRQVAGMSAPRNAEPFTYPDAAHLGPKVCLLNQWSASDGDLFPHFFRRYGLGPLIGKRSWGGVVGIRGTPNLVDGGYVTMPEFAYYDMDSKWMIENHGVDPDIEVDNPPGQVLRGKDPQLDRAIGVILQQIDKHPPRLPPRPPDPGSDK